MENHGIISFPFPFSEDCDEWEQSLTPSRKRLAKQTGKNYSSSSFVSWFGVVITRMIPKLISVFLFLSVIDKPYKREALEVDIGTRILVQGATTSQPPYSPQNPSYSPNFPQNPSNSPTFPQNPSYSPIFPQNPFNSPTFPQNPSNSPTFPQNPSFSPNFPQNPSYSPNSPTFPPNPSNSPNFPQNPPYSPTFPQNPPYSPTQPPDSTFRPIVFPDTGPQTTPTPSANPPNQTPPTIFHNPFFPKDLFPSSGSRPNPNDGGYARPPNQNPASQEPTRPSGYFPGQTTPNSLFPNLPTQKPGNSNPPPQRPGFPIPPNQGPGYIHPTTRRPKFPGFTIPIPPTTRKPCSCRNHTTSATPSFFSPSPVAPPFPNASPQFPTPTPGFPRPVTPHSGGFRPGFRPNYTPIAAFPVFPNQQPRPVLFVPFYRPQELIPVNQRPVQTNGLSGFPLRQPTNRQRFPALPHFRLFVPHDTNQVKTK